MLMMINNNVEKMDIILNNYIDITLFCRFTFRLRIYYSVYLPPPRH